MKLSKPGFMVYRDRAGTRFGWAFRWGGLFIEWKARREGSA